MKYIKLFEENRVYKDEYPEDGHGLSIREINILKELVGGKIVKNFSIKKDDGYYYLIGHKKYVYKFDGFLDLKDYLIFIHCMDIDNPSLFLETLKETKIDISFDKRFILWACEEGYTEIVKILIKNKNTNLSNCLDLASRNGHTEVVKLLLQDSRVDPISSDISCAIANGHTEIVEILLKDNRAKPDEHDIITACVDGYTEIVKLLLRNTDIDPSYGDNLAIRGSSRNGHTEIVKLLLQDPRVDPSDYNNDAIKGAIKKGHKEIFKILSEDPRVRKKKLL